MVMEWLVLAVVFALLWWRQRSTRNATSVDLGWCLGVLLLGLWWSVQQDGATDRRALIAALYLLWFGRLAWHVWHDRVAGGKAEDGRYTLLRQRFAAREQTAMLLFYQAQAIFVLGFALPAWVAAQDPRPLWQPLDVVAVLIWSGAFLGEWLADRQLAAWRSDPAHAGRTCRYGLWRYSRHPNYFFQWCQWLAWPLLAWASPWLPLVALWPLLVLWLLIRWTGVPYTEQRALASRGDDYRRYQRTTSMFIPWFPHKEQEA